MNAETILPLFPLLPVAGIILHLFFTYVLKREPGRATLLGSLGLQTAAAAAIIFYFLQNGSTDIGVAVSRWNFSIQLALNRERVFLLAALMVPLLFALAKTISDLASQRENVVNSIPPPIFLFYIAACSGILMTADIFNFFVFYELMIMAAYILISVEGKYFASIKYMLVGGISSCFFLAGIIFVYASGLPFTFSALADLSSLPLKNAKFILLFFAAAFSIKSALFPASSWLPTCHSAANGTVSAFLSSFTVVSGFFGLYYLVLLPAESLSYTVPFTVLKYLSLITMGVSALFIFFEGEIKRCIAGTTVFSAGFIGLLFSVGAYEPAWIYIMVHAFYKSVLFHQADTLSKESLYISGKRTTLIIGAVMLLFAAGLVPSLPHFIKSYAGLSGPGLLSVLYGADFLLLAGFTKFGTDFKPGGPSRPGDRRWKQGWMLILIIPLFFALYGLFFFFFPVPLRKLFYGKALIFGIEWGVVAAAFVWGRLIYPKISMVSNIDTRFVFRNLNIELFFILVLFGGWTAFLFFL